ncbi:MAG TPA: hypothetical protein VJO52_14975 [Gemmatimonadaceae bacterium]|nr:hypothetical protein [Gemmatimonadaceae bacterium]
MSPAFPQSPRDDLEPPVPRPPPGQPELRTLALEHTVRWVPLHDTVPALSAPLGTVAAVEPLVIHQQVLAGVETHVSTSPALAFGVLYGAIYRCPRLRMDYALIEGVERGAADADANADLRLALEEVIARLHARGVQALGWYRAGVSPGLQISPTDSAMHATLFPEPWCVALLHDTSTPRSQAALVRLTSRLRPYAVPFYELLPAHHNGQGDSVRSVIDWPTYRTTADVIRAESKTAAPPLFPTESSQQAPQFNDIERIFDAPAVETANTTAFGTPRRRSFPLFSFGPRTIRVALAALAVAVAIAAAWFFTH